MLSSDLEVYLPNTVSNDSTNGGRMSANKVISGVIQNVWPHIPKAERLSGSTKQRKLFCKVSDDTDGTLIAPQYWLDDITPGDDWVFMFAGTLTDTQGDLTGTERKYGTARLNADVVAGTDAIELVLEDATLGTGDNLIAVAGDSLRLTDMADPTSVTGNEEFFIIDTVSVVDTIMSITTTANIANDYTVASGARAMTIYEPGDVECSTDTAIVTSTAGTFDDTLVVCDNIGTIYQTMTFTFSDATNFTVTSDVAGITLDAGDTTTDYIPMNADFTKPYGTIPITAWGGTYEAGDTVELPFNPAVIAIWETRVVPANAASQDNNKVTQVTAGEYV